MTRPDGRREAPEEEGGEDLRPEDLSPPHPLTYRDLIAMQRRLKGNRSLFSLRSNNGRTNSLRLALAALSATLWAFAVHAHGPGSWLGIGWSIMMVAATGNLVASLLIGLRVVAIGEQILRIGAGDLEHRTALPGRDETVRLCEALEKLRARSARVVKLQLVERMTARLEDRNATLRKTIESLKRTQDRIVVGQKAVELGVLTAGVAHEIRNPLNFVRNFSEGARELVAEMAQGIEGQNDRIGTRRMDTLRELRAEVEENFERIAAHTERADAIVEQMLMLGETQGAAQDVELNALVGRHSRLACRAAEQKDPGLGVRLEEVYDERVGELTAVPQALARVVLNLVSNACYAAGEGPKDPSEDYEPTVWVETRRNEGEVEIEVRDNGPGIDEAIREKVLTPFFTTKPPNVATGLGLSQCADAVRQHGGTIAIGSGPEGGASVRLTIPEQGLDPDRTGPEPAANAARV